MVYLFILTLLTLYLYSIARYFNKATFSAKCLLCLPFLFIWVIVIGGQYYVGSDYLSYKILFEGGGALSRHLNSYEYFFVGITKVSQFLGLFNELGGQNGWMLSAFITGVCFSIITICICNKNFALFYFTFIVSSPLFHYQMNGLRQSLAFFCGNAAFVLFCKNKKLISLFFFILMLTSHWTTICSIPIFAFVYYIMKTDNRNLLFTIVCCSIFACLFISERLFAPFLSFLPLKICYYVQEGAIFSTSLPLFSKLSKLIYLPLIVYALFNIKKVLDKSQKEFIISGVVFYSFRLISCTLGALYRLGVMCDIMLCLPIAFALKIIYRKNKYLFCLVAIILLSFYAYKVLIYKHEIYSYDSVFFTYCKN